MKTYEHCRSIKQVEKVLKNYDGQIYRDCGTLGGWWIDVDCQEFWGWDRADIIKQANELFKRRGWTSGLY